MTSPDESGTQADGAQAYPGQRIGRPKSGSGSVETWLRRFLALVIDWFASRLVAAIIFGGTVISGDGAEQFAVFGVFVVEASLLTTLLGGSFGQLVMRTAVVRLDGKPLSLLRSLARSVLICLVVPPLIFNRDNRGAHDLLVDSVVVRR